MAATSGFLVPPTWSSAGCSQNRVTAIGMTPQLSSVSVTDGTKLTTRTAAATGLHAVEQLGLLGVEFGL